MNSRRLWFCTFGSIPTWKNALERLEKSVNQLKFFDEIKIYNQASISMDYLEKHHKFILSNPRGWGYYLWKPFIILQTLERMSPGDVLLYIDSGCHIYDSGMIRLKEYIQLADKHKLLTFEVDHQEQCWTKSDLLQQFPNVSPQSKQIISGIHLWKKCPETSQLANDWLQLVQDYHNIDDTPSIHFHENINFKEHRHDQSCFSLLVKNSKLGLTIPDESWWPGAWNSRQQYPIHALRDRD
jgi:hypothetical protein